MAADDRFYQMHLTTRPLWWGDLGNRFQISGFLLMGETTCCLVVSPNTSLAGSTLDAAKVLQPSVAEWWDIIRATDDPSVFILDSTNGIKAVHRKVRYTISGAVQQKVWARDWFKCLYCGRKMGEIQLTVDHFNPLEYGGRDEPGNYVSACRACNKRKGSIPAEQWCREQGLNYEDIVLQAKKPL